MSTETVLGRIEDAAREFFLQTGTFGYTTSVSRPDFLTLIGELQDERVYYSFGESVYSPTITFTSRRAGRVSVGVE